MWWIALGSAIHKRSSCGAPSAYITAVLNPTQKRGAYTKRPVPTSYSSIFFQEALLNNSRLLAVPPPHVPCSEICEMIPLRGVWDTEIPYIQDGFFGPGTSLIETV